MAAPLVFMVNGDFRVCGDAKLCAGGAELVPGWVGVFGCFEHPLTIKTAVKDK